MAEAIFSLLHNPQISMEVKMKNCKCLIILMCLLAVLSQTAIADDSVSQDKNWEFNLAPFYLWGVDIDGDVTIGTNTVPVELPFSDIIDNLEAAFIVHFEGMHKSNWGFLVDVNYLDVSNDVNLPGPFNRRANKVAPLGPRTIVIFDIRIAK